MSPTEESPILKTEAAKRRLKILFPDGVPTTSSRPESTSMDSTAYKETPSYTVHATVLSRPVEVDHNLPGEIKRDVMAEIAVTPKTLHTLKLPPGALVKVSNPEKPQIRSRLARVWPSSELQGEAAVAPTLAYNLGLCLHLLPLLRKEEEGDSLDEFSAPICIQAFSSLSSSRKVLDEEESDAESSLATRTYSTLPQPSTLEDAQIRIADEVQIYIVREPQQSWLPMLQDSHAQNSFTLLHGSSMQDPVDTIKSYFLDGQRAVCEGDVLAVMKEETDFSAAAAILENISISRKEDEATEWEFANFVFFKVNRVLPEGTAIQTVDSTKTTVRLAGSCCSGIPVGLRGYLGPQAPPRSFLGWDSNASLLHRGWNLPFVGELLPHWKIIAQLAAAVLHPAAVNLNLKLAVLLHGPVGAGKRTAVTAAAAALGCHCTRINCRDIRGYGPQPDGKTMLEGLKVAFDVAARYKPSFLVLEDFQILESGGEPHADAQASRLGALLAECIQSAAGLKSSFSRQKDLYPSPVLLIACCNTPDDIPTAMRRCFTHEIEITAPDAAAREILLKSFIGSGGGASLNEFDWEDMARHTAGLLPRDLKSFAADACTAAALSIYPSEDLFNPPPSEEQEEEKDSPSVNDLHISTALDNARERMATDIGAPKIPNVQWEDVGGLEDVKLSILDTVELPLKHPELFSGGLRRRSGVLLYGPPGTGKTLLAKAVATECAVNFLSVKGPELINMYVGESERQIREVFARARRAKPCVVFFDELDSLAPARGKGSDSGGVMDRVVSQLLAEIDSAQGGSGTDDVFIIGATNRPDLLDPALLRPGRLDKLLYVGVASDDEAQFKVITALTRKFSMGPSVELDRVAERCPPRLTGADLYALCSDAWMIALKRHVAAAEGVVNGKQQEEQEVVVVEQEDFESALGNLRPSLTEDDIVHYERIRDQYAGK